MICFPDPSILLAALAQGVVPVGVRQSPVAAGFDPHDRLWVRAASPLPGSVVTELVRLGATVHETGETPLAEELGCWHQLVPVRRSSVLPTLSAETPVLFEVVDAAHWPRFAGELRRLGRQGAAFHWGDGAAASSVFLRITGPPCYSLLRALERDDPALPFRAYVEQAPRVWVEIGCRQPFAEEVLPPPGKRWLIRAPRNWSLVEDATFAEGLDALPLPAVSGPWESAACKELLPLAVRLVPGGTAAPAELWVLDQDPIGQLASLVNDADDDLLSRLWIVAGQVDGRQVVVLRVQTSRRAPPVLMLAAQGYRPYLKLPNVFLPCGLRLQPSLRRDAVRQLLAHDPERVAWLRPRGDGTFGRESLPAAAFRPLREAFRYSVPHERHSLRPWQPTSPIEFEPYVCEPDDPVAGLRHRGAAGRGSKGGTLDRLWDWFRNAVLPSPPAAPARIVRPEPMQAPEPAFPAIARDRVAEAVNVFLQAPSARTLASLEPVPAPEVHSRQKALEEHFLKVPGPPDAAQRRALWPELAGTYAAAGNAADAAVCWMNALWETDGPAPLWWWGWFRAEAQGARWYDIEVDVERVLAARRVEPADARAVAAFSAWTAWSDAAAQTPAGIVAALRSRVTSEPNRIRQFLEVHEPLLPTRAAWLAWTGLSRLAGGDVLGLARARDRLLERLYHKGLSVDHDLPSFLRFAGQGAPQRSQTIRDWLVQQRGPIHQWIERLHARVPRDPAESSPHLLITERYRGKLPPYGAAGEAQLTKAYADLTLAWGLARLGLSTTCMRLIDEARGVLGDRDEVHVFLLSAYTHRILQALERHGDSLPLPESLLVELQRLDPEHQRYKVDRLRAQSRVLEPNEKIDPYRGHVQRHYFDSLHRKLAALAEVRDRQQLSDQVHQLLREDAEVGAARAALPRVLATALELSPRVGESFAIDLLNRVTPALEGLTEATEQAPLLERALFVAAHFGQPAHVDALVARFEQMLDPARGPAAAVAFESLAAQSFRGLRKLGRRDAIDRLLNQMADCLLQGQPIRALRTRLGVNRPVVLRTLLHVAAGWFYAGDDAKATGVLDEVRVLLFEGRLPAKDQPALARAYAASLGQAPLALAMERVEELLGRLDRVHDRFSTNSHFSLTQLDVVEAVVAGVVNDDFALGATVRRWLDEDEYLVRRRIQRDLRTLL